MLANRMRMAAAGRAATVEFQASAVSTSVTSIFTFSAQPLGDAAADRIIIITIAAFTGGTSGVTVSSVTVGGTSLAQAIWDNSESTHQTNAGIWVGAVPTGTTGDVVVTFSTNISNGVGICVYAGYGASAAESDDGSAAGAAVTVLQDTGATVPAGGFAIAVCATNDGTTVTTTWAGVTETVDEAVSAFRWHSSGALAYDAAQSSLTISSTFSGPASVNGATMTWASFGP